MSKSDKTVTVIATEKFKELDSANNWGFIGKDAYEKLERGEAVTFIDSPKTGVHDALKGKFVKQTTSKE